MGLGSCLRLGLGLVMHAPMCALWVVHMLGLGLRLGLGLEELGSRLGRVKRVGVRRVRARIRVQSGAWRGSQYDRLYPYMVISYTC